MGFRDLMEINPTFFVALVGALGLKDILWEWIKRCWSKSDEKYSDHKKLEELEAKLDAMNVKFEQIINRLDKMEENDKESAFRDLKFWETEVAEMQNRAIIKDKVSNSCMPRYLENYKLYNQLAELTPHYDVPEEIKLNHEKILQLVKDGKSVDNLREWYK